MVSRWRWSGYCKIRINSRNELEFDNRRPTRLSTPLPLHPSAPLLDRLLSPVQSSYPSLRNALDQEVTTAKFRRCSSTVERITPSIFARAQRSQSPDRSSSTLPVRRCKRKDYPFVFSSNSPRPAADAIALATDWSGSSYSHRQGEGSSLRRVRSYRGRKLDRSSEYSGRRIASVDGDHLRRIGQHRDGW